MANDLRERPDLNPGQRHGDDLFEHFEREYANPSASSTAEEGHIDQAKAAARQAESNATNQPPNSPRSVGQQEEDPSFYLGNSTQLRAQSIRNRKNGKPLGIFIAFGAGGGIVSVIAGFGFLMPFHLPGVLDPLIGDGGKRIERYLEKRGERVIVSYFFDRDRIVTGNPYGDFIANVRTSNFEERIKSKYGLSMERAENGTLRLVHDGSDLGKFKNADELLQFLDRDDLNVKEVRQIFGLLAKNDIPVWRFFKKAKFVKWLRLKYNIPRFGAREQRVDESDEEYRRNIASEHYEQGQNANLRNVEDFATCGAEGGDCEDLDRAGGADELEDGARRASQELAEESADIIAEGAERPATRVLSTRMVALMGVGAITYFGTIDIAARLVHGLGKAINDDSLRKKHAEYISRSTGVFGALYAGYSDQVKAGGLDAGAAGMFATRLNGWEESKSYNHINNGTTDGVGLTSMEKIGDASTTAQFGENLKLMFNTVGWIGRAPLEGWYLTISRAIDFAGGKIGDMTSFLAEKVPGYKTVMAQFAGYMSFIFDGLLQLLGMYVDPASVGPKLAMYIHEGLLSAFNGHAQSMGMRLLTPEQALKQDVVIRAEKLETMASMSFADRVLNLNNSESMVSAIVARLPVGNNTNVFGDLAKDTVRMIASTPVNIARVTTGTAYAAEPTITSEQLFDTKSYGALPGDEKAPLDPNAWAPTPLTCPENNDNAINHCKIDRELVSSMSCAFVKCSDIENPTGGGSGSGSPIITGDAKHLAQQILDNPNITFEPGDNERRGAKKDFELTAAGAKTACGDGEGLNPDPTLMQAMLTAAKKYSFRINALISDHSCNNGQHPKGKAADFGMVNGKTAIASENIELYRQFAIDFSNGMTTGGHINQKNCIGEQKLANNVKMTYDQDSCDHLHVDVP